MVGIIPSRVTPGAPTEIGMSSCTMWEGGLSVRLPATPGESRCSELESGGLSGRETEKKEGKKGEQM